MAVPAVPAVPLSPSQQAIIKSTAPVLAQHGETITKLFYETILRENPSLNNIFNATHQRSGHQARALAASLFAYATHIDDLPRLSALIELVCHKHASLHVRPEHYPVVGKYLLAAMGDVLGAALTPEVRDAWAAAYAQLAAVMISREEQLYERADGGRWRDWRDLRVARKVPESPDVTSFYLEPVDGRPLPSFLPGQYVSVQLGAPDRPFKQARQYSLSERPLPDHYRISVKREDDGAGPNDAGFVSSILHDRTQAGDVISVSAPYGDFFFDAAKHGAESPVVLLSAGVGLTCLLAILNSLTAAKSARPISWIHGARTSATRPFGSHVQGLVAANANVHAVRFCSAPTADDVLGSDYELLGRVDLTRLDKDRDLFLGDGTAEYFVCGPESFMREIRSGLMGLGVGEGRIHLELFGTGGVPVA